MGNAETRFCEGIRKGDILKVSAGNWLYKSHGTKKVVVIKVEERAEATPLLTVVNQDLKIDSYDSAHFYEKPKPKEMTVAEISEKLGHEVKIIK